MFQTIGRLVSAPSRSDSDNSSSRSRGGSMTGLFFHRSVKQTPTTELAAAALARAEAKLAEAEALFKPSETTPSQKKSWTVIPRLPHYNTLSYKALFRSDANNLAHYQRRIERAKQNLATTLGCTVEELPNKCNYSQEQLSIGDETIPMHATVTLGAIKRSEIEQGDMDLMGKSTLEDLLAHLERDTENGTWSITRDRSGQVTSLSYNDSVPNETSPSASFDEVKAAIESLAGEDEELQRALAYSVNSANCVGSLAVVKAASPEIATLENRGLGKHRPLQPGEYDLQQKQLSPSRVQITLQKTAASTFTLTGTGIRNERRIITTDSSGNSLPGNGESTQLFTSRQNDSITRSIEKKPGTPLSIKCTAATIAHAISDTGTTVAYRID